MNLKIHWSFLESVMFLLALCSFVLAQSSILDFSRVCASDFPNACPNEEFSQIGAIHPVRALRCLQESTLVSNACREALSSNPFAPCAKSAVLVCSDRVLNPGVDHSLDNEGTGSGNHVSDYIPFEVASFCVIEKASSRQIVLPDSCQTFLESTPAYKCDEDLNRLCEDETSDSISYLTCLVESRKLVSLACSSSLVLFPDSLESMSIQAQEAYLAAFFGLRDPTQVNREYPAPPAPEGDKNRKLLWLILPAVLAMAAIGAVLTFRRITRKAYVHVPNNAAI